MRVVSPSPVALPLPCYSGQVRKGRAEWITASSNNLSKCIITPRFPVDEGWKDGKKKACLLHRSCVVPVQSRC